MRWNKIKNNKLPDKEGYYLFSNGDGGYNLLYYHKDEDTWTRAGEHPQVISGLDIYEESEIIGLFKYYKLLPSDKIKD